MKNKKLFAILTLVCFMFTLMPVAAFAAADDAVYVKTAEGSATQELDVKAGQEFFAGVNSGLTTSGYVFYVVDEDGTEFELEVLSTLEYNGFTYLAVVPAGESLEELELEVSILKSVEEDGESILSAIEDEEELQAVYDLIMDALYEEDEEE